MKQKLYIFAAAGFALLVLLLFSPWWAGGKLCAPLDIVSDLYEPWADATKPVTVQNHFPTDTTEHYLLYQYHAQLSYQQEGQLGWNYLKNCGTAAYANTMATYSDWSRQLHRFLPFWTAWHVGLMGQLFLALFGMFVFLKDQGYKAALSVTGALGFGLCSHFAVWIYHGWALGAMCWLPLICWAFYKMRSGSRWGLAAPLFLALGFMGGHIQYAAFLVIAVGSLWLGWAFENFFGKRTFQCCQLMAVILAGLLAVGLAAVMFIPCTYGYIITNIYGLTRGGLGYPQGPLSPFFHLLAYPFYIFPLILGSCHSYDLFRGFKTGLMLVPFFGSLLVLLAFCGTFLRKLNVIAKVIVLAGLVLPLTPLVGPLYQRLLIFFVFGGVWLAVDLMQYLPDEAWMKIRKFASWLWIFGSGALLLFSIVLTVFEADVFTRFWAVLDSVVSNHKFGARVDWFEQRAHVLLTELKLWNPRMLFPWLLFGLSVYTMRFRRKAFFGWALAGLVFGQLWMYDRDWVVFCHPRDEVQSIYPETEEIRAVRAEIGQTGRVITAQRSDRVPLFPLNSLSYFDVPCVVGYDSILPNGIQKDVPYNPVIGETLPSPQLLGEKGVTHLIAYADDKDPGDGWHLLRTAGEIDIYSNELARSWYRIETTNGVQSISPSVHKHNSRRLEIPEGTKKVMLCENWDEGWQYRLNDSDWVYMQLADDRSMVAEFDALTGPAVFEMRYRPRVLLAGRTVSVASLGLYVLFCVLYLKKRSDGS